MPILEPKISRKEENAFFANSPLLRNSNYNMFIVIFAQFITQAWREQHLPVIGIFKIGQFKYLLIKIKFNRYLFKW